ncbi:hypothetical protein D3C87_76570 [compost metagenome]
MREFDYNFHVCPICNNKMREEHLGSTDLWCKNGCCKYDVDPQGETVSVSLFNDEENNDLNFLLELYKEARLQWEPLDDDDYKMQKELDREMEKFLNAISYWKENDRYLVRILEGKYDE